MAVKVLAFEGFRRRVRDVARSTAFYCEGLGFSAAGKGRLRLGDETIELVEDGSAAHPDAARYAEGAMDTGFQHLAIVAADMAAAYRRLCQVAPRALSRGGPVTLPAAAGGVTAFKFLDPDGRPLELIRFPPGSGDARWQRAGTGALTLGIDHSAIAVSDTGRSIAFYRDELGFEVAAQQRNHGPSQEDLDGIDGVQVDVVALKPALDPTPHLELLGYVVPATLARPGTDMLLWRAALEGDLEEFMATDPDGHRHLLRTY